jgi:hypothetical protein
MCTAEPVMRAFTARVHDDVVEVGPVVVAEARPGRHQEPLVSCNARLWAACRINDEQAAVDALVDGADPVAYDSTGMCAVDYAVVHGCGTLLRMLFVEYKPPRWFTRAPGMPLGVAVVLLNKVDPLGCLQALPAPSLAEPYASMGAHGWALAQGKHDLAGLIVHLLQGGRVVGSWKRAKPGSLTQASGDMPLQPASGDRM